MLREADDEGCGAAAALVALKSSTVYGVGTYVKSVLKAVPAEIETASNNASASGSGSGNGCSYQVASTCLALSARVPDI